MLQYIWFVGDYMKVIFLDIDGVLNTADTFNKTSKTFINQYNHYHEAGIRSLEIDKFRLEYLKELIDETEAKIVLSSTWRRFFIKENNKIVPRTIKGKQLYELFNSYGLEIYDLTPINMESREEQINIWLSQNDDIESFVIIDDEPNLFKFLLDRFVVEDNKIIAAHAVRSNGTTNNREEMKAIIWALEKFGNRHPIVYSDSAYAVNTFSSWMWNWKRNNWIKFN